MAYSNARISIDDFADKMTLKYRIKKSDTARLIEFITDAYRYLNLFHIDENVYYKKVSMTDVKTINLPADCVGVVDLYYDYNGEIWTLTRKDDIISTKTLADGALTNDSDYGEGGLVHDESYYMYGNTGGKNTHYYRVDLPNRRIVVSGVERTDLVLAYVVTGLNLDATTYIPVKAMEVMEKYVIWQYYSCEENYPASRTEVKRRDFKDALVEFKDFNGPNMTEIKDIIWGSQTNAPQR